MSCNSSDFITVFNVNISSILKGLSTPYINRLGGYGYLERDKLDEDIDRRNAGVDDPDADAKRRSGNRCQIEYLRKIIDLCEKSDIKPFMMTPPIYQVDRFYDMPRFDSLRMAISPDVEYLDFSRMELPDSLYADVDHLNYRGAKVFSEMLNGYFDMPKIDSATLE